MYKLISNSCALHVESNTSFPFDTANSDYQQYLAWLAEGNTPEPADPLPNPRIVEIKQELDLIDRKSIRALREGDTTRITQWEAQAQALRQELAAL